jgi:hypothetical protein
MQEGKPAQLWWRPAKPAALIGLSLITSVFQTCDTVPLQTTDMPQVAGCQSCHLSPPPTGEHLYHLYKVTGKPNQILCEDCHASAVSQTFWEPVVRRKKLRSFLSWDRLELSPPAMSLIWSPVDTLSYSLCLTEIRGNVLYGARRDSAVIFIGAPQPGDSIHAAADSIRWFAYDSTIIRGLDTIGSGPQPLIDTIKIKVYKAPLAYSACDHLIRNDTLFKSTVLGFPDTLLQLDEGDSLIERRQYNRRFVLSPNFNLRDTLTGVLVPPESTTLAGMPPVQRRQFTTQVGENQYIIRAVDTTLRQIDTAVRMFVDTLLYQVEGNSLYLLERDSTVHFGNNLFSTTTSLHGNNRIDILFRQEEQTLFRRDTLRARIDTLSGDTLGYDINHIGAWSPRRASCWSFGLNPANCHENVYVEKFWYNPRDTLIQKSRLGPWEKH